MSTSWLTFHEWSHASINSYRLATDLPPVPAVGVALGLAWLILLTLVLTRRLRRQRFWPIAGAMGLGGWLLLDALWQVQLLRQVAGTHQTYAGLAAGERLLAAPDADLYRFAQQVKQHVDPSAARVFVSSDDDFTGMRSAWFLYPLNVYWRRFQPVPPIGSPALRSGDFVVVLAPSAARYYAAAGYLQFTDAQRLDATLVAADEMGGLFRVR